MKIKVLFLSEPSATPSQFAMEFEAESVLELVKRIVDHDGLFLNSEKSDWIPKHRILRVWSVR